MTIVAGCVAKHGQEGDQNPNCPFDKHSFAVWLRAFKGHEDEDCLLWLTKSGLLWQNSRQHVCWTPGTANHRTNTKPFGEDWWWVASNSVCVRKGEAAETWTLITSEGRMNAAKYRGNLWTTQTDKLKQLEQSHLFEWQPFSCLPEELNT